MSSTKKTIRFNDYSTSHRSFQTWADRWFGSKASSIIPRLLLYCLTPFLIGLSISYLIGFEKNYLKTIPIYIGLFGILLTCSVLLYGSIMIHKSFSLARPVFTVSDEKYKELITKYFRLCASSKHAIIASIVFFIYAILALIITYHRVDPASPRLSAFSSSLFVETGWYDESFKYVKFAILFIYAIFCSLPLGTAAWILTINFVLVVSLFKLPVVPIPNLIYSRLESLTDFYLRITVTWFVGVTLFVVMFVRALDMVSFCFVATLSVFGLLTFLTPQFLYRNLIEKSRSQGTSIALCDLYQSNNIEFKEISDETSTERDNMTINNLFNNKLFQQNVSDVISVEQKWIYNPWEMLAFVGSQAFPFIAIYLKQIFT